jgi:hypothetical protein
LLLNLNDSGKIVNIYWGGDCVMESGCVPLGNLFFENPTHKDRRDYYKETSHTYPFSITGDKVKDLELRPDFVEKGAYSLPGDIENNQGFHKALAMQRHSGNEFTGRLCDLVNARYGMLPFKLSFFEQNPDYPVIENLEGFSQPDFIQPFEYNLLTDEGENTYVSSIKLFRNTLRSVFTNTSFIFLAQDYRMFLGKITNTEIYMSECQFTGMGNKIKATLNKGVFPPNLDRDMLLSFLYTQIKSVGDEQLIYDFSSLNLEFTYGIPVMYGWHASFQINSLGQQKLSIVLRKKESTSAYAGFLNALITIDIAFLNNSWTGSHSIETGGVYKNPPTNYIWWKDYPNKTLKNADSFLASKNGNGFFYVFYTKEDEVPLIVKYLKGQWVQKKEDVDTLYTYSTNQSCGLQSGVKISTTENINVDGWYFNKGSITKAESGNSSMSGSIIQYTATPTSTVDNWGDYNSVTPNNVCDGEALEEEGIIFSQCGKWNVTNPENMGVYLQYQYYNADRVDISVSRSSTRRQHILFQGADSVIILNFKNTNYKDRVVTKEILNGSTPIGWYDWITDCEKMPDGSIIKITTLGGLHSFKAPTFIGSGNTVSDVRLNHYNLEMDAYVANPIFNEQVYKDIAVDGVWLNMYAAELLDFEISPVVETQHGNRSCFNIHIDSASLLGNYQNIVFGGRIVGGA